VDLIFSTATFHEIQDHDRLLRRLAQAFKPQGQLVAQCGGKDNIARTQNAMEQVMGEGPFPNLSRAWKTPGTLRLPRRRWLA
jgi:trans-aconitate 2-methyltransferase